MESIYTPSATSATTLRSTLNTQNKNEVLLKIQELKKINQILEQEINTLEQQLQNIGDDSQLANIDLQNSLQKQQQTITSLSNISSVLHDTATVIIRNMG